MLQSKRIVAAIDVGTSRIKFEMQQFDENSSGSVLAREKETINIGEDVKRDGVVSSNTIEAVCKNINRYASIARKYSVQKLKGIATEALRSAGNANETIHCIQEKTGVKLEILSQDEEAKLFFKTVSKDFPKEMIAVVDVGGGSVQLIIGNDKNIEKLYLLKTGTVFLKNRFIRHSKPKQSEKDAIQKFLDDAMRNFETMSYCPTRLVYGTTNVIDFLEAMNINFAHSKTFAHHNKYCFREDIREVCNRIFVTPYEERGAMYPKDPFFMHGADLALLNVLSICDKFNIDKIHPSNANTLSAILRKLAEK